MPMMFSSSSRSRFIGKTIIHAGEAQPPQPADDYCTQGLWNPDVTGEWVNQGPDPLPGGGGRDYWAANTPAGTYYLYFQFTWNIGPTHGDTLSDFYDGNFGTSLVPDASLISWIAGGFNPELKIVGDYSNGPCPGPGTTTTTTAAPGTTTTTTAAPGTTTTTTAAPGGLQLYTSDDGNLYTVDPITANKTLVGNNGQDMRSLTYWSPNGKFISTSNGAASNSIFVDPSTGAVTNPTSNWINEITDATKASDGNIYYMVNPITAGGGIYRLDNPDSGLITLISSPIDFGDPNQALVTMDNGQSYYTAGAPTPKIWGINCATGESTTGVTGPPVVLTGAITQGIRAMANLNGTLYAIDVTGSGGAGRLITIDPTTGVCTLVGTGNAGTWYSLETIPDPVFGTTTTTTAATNPIDCGAAALLDPTSNAKIDANDNQYPTPSLHGLEGTVFVLQGVNNLPANPQYPYPGSNYYLATGTAYGNLYLWRDLASTYWFISPQLNNDGVGVVWYSPNAYLDYPWKDGSTAVPDGTIGLPISGDPCDLCAYAGYTPFGGPPISQGEFSLAREDFNGCYKLNP